MEEIALWICKCCEFNNVAKKMNDNTLAIFCLNIILRVDRKCSWNKAYIYICIYGIYHSKFFSRHTSVNIIKHWKLRLHKLHILTWSHHFLFLVFQYDMPVIDLLSLSYKLTLFACSVKMNLGPLSVIFLCQPPWCFVNQG